MAVGKQNFAARCQIRSSYPDVFRFVPKRACVRHGFVFAKRGANQSIATATGGASGGAMLRAVASVIQCCNRWNWMDASAFAQDGSFFMAVMQCEMERSRNRVA